MKERHKYQHGFANKTQNPNSKQHLSVIHHHTPHEYKAHIEF